MSNTKLLLITFDYELFLGERSGTVQNCLINPTNNLLACLDEHAFKAVFFIDTVYILRLMEMAADHHRAKADLEAITNQLVQIVKKGHEVHPHIHPHWMDAIYDPKVNEWNLSEKRFYTFASISEENRAKLFGNTVAFIKSILELANRIQPIDCYRAGGWSIQPFLNFKPFFIQHGIKNEWSIIPGKYQFSDAHSFDFRKAPVQNPIYRFQEDPCLEDRDGQFQEMTISSLSLNRFEKWFDFKISGILSRLGKRPPFMGKGVSSVIKDEGDSYCNGKQKRIVASFEGLNPFTLRKYFLAIRKADYFHFISHPKLITPYEFKMIDKLFKILKKINGIKTDFRDPLTE
jgi:hypothetical protein